MFANFLQFTALLVLYTLVTIGVVGAAAPVYRWLRSIKWLPLDRCTAQYAAVLILAAAVFVLANLHSFGNEFLSLLSLLLYGVFIAVAIGQLQSWKLHEKWQWDDPDACAGNSDSGTGGGKLPCPCGGGEPRRPCPCGCSCGCCKCSGKGGGKRPGPCDRPGPCGGSGGGTAPPGSPPPTPPKSGCGCS